MVGAFDLLKPTRVEVEKLAPRLAQVTVEPLERGFGYTLGNASAADFVVIHSGRRDRRVRD
jgi:hypothetical protein